MSEKIARRMKTEEKRIDSLRPYRFKRATKVVDKEGKLFCVIDPSRKQVILTDVDGNLHYYSIPLKTGRGMVPAVSKEQDG